MSKRMDWEKVTAARKPTYTDKDERQKNEFIFVSFSPLGKEYLFKVIKFMAKYGVSHEQVMGANGVYPLMCDLGKTRANVKLIPTRVARQMAAKYASGKKVTNGQTP